MNVAILSSALRQRPKTLRIRQAPIVSGQARCRAYEVVVSHSTQLQVPCFPATGPEHTRGMGSGTVRFSPCFLDLLALLLSAAPTVAT